MAHHKHDKHDKKHDDKHDKKHDKHHGHKEDRRVPPSVGGPSPQARRDAEVAQIRAEGKKPTSKQKRHERRQKREARKADKKQRNSENASIKLPSGRKYSHVQYIPTMDDLQKKIRNEKWTKKEKPGKYHEAKDEKKIRKALSYAARHGPTKSRLQGDLERYLGQEMWNDKPISPLEKSQKNFLQQMLGQTPEEMMEGRGAPQQELPYSQDSGLQENGFYGPPDQQANAEYFKRLASGETGQQAREGMTRGQDAGSEMDALGRLSTQDMQRVAAAKRAAINSGQPRPSIAEILGQQQAPQAQSVQQMLGQGQPMQQMGQQQQYQQAPQQGQQGMLGGFEWPYLQQYRKRAGEIAQAFSGMGGIRGSGFQGAILDAQQDVQGNLASVKASLYNQLLGRQLEAAGLAQNNSQIENQRHGLRQQAANMAIPVSQIPAQQWQQQLQAMPPALAASQYRKQAQQQMNQNAQNVDWQHQQAIMNTPHRQGIAIAPRNQTASSIPARVGSALTNGATLAAAGYTLGGAPGAVIGGIGGAASGFMNPGGAVPAVNLQMPQPIGSAAPAGGGGTQGGLAPAWRPPTQSMVV